MCIPAPAITCVRTHHAQYQKKTNESFWYCAWCLRTHVIAGAGRHFPVLLLPSTRHTRQKVLKTEQIWTSIRGWTKSKILVRKTTRRSGNFYSLFHSRVDARKERLYWDNRWTQRQQRPCPCGRRPSPRGKQGEDSLLHTVLNEALLVCLGLPLETTEREAFRLETFSAQLAVPGRPRGRDQRPRALDQLLSAGWAQGSTRRLLSCLLYTSPSPRDKRQSRMPSSA